MAATVAALRPLLPLLLLLFALLPRGHCHLFFEPNAGEGEPFFWLTQVAKYLLFIGPAL